MRRPVIRTYNVSSFHEHIQPAIDIAFVFQKGVARITSDFVAPSLWLQVTTYAYIISFVFLSIFFLSSLLFGCCFVLKSCYGCCRKKCVNCLIVLVHFSRYSTLIFFLAAVADVAGNEFDFPLTHFRCCTNWEMEHYFFFPYRIPFSHICFPPYKLPFNFVHLVRI